MNIQYTHHIRISCNRLVRIVGLLLCFGVSGWADTGTSGAVPLPPPPPDPAEIIRRLDAAAEERQVSLVAYTSERQYTVRNSAFKFERQLEVEMRYSAPDTKTYVTRGKGSTGVFYSKVFKQILDSEVQHARPGLRITTAVTSRNYRFEWDGEETILGEACWRLKLQPRRRSRFLMAGRIWLSRNDCGIVRLDGHPAEKPSFWTLDVHLIRDYRKVDGYWMPASDRSVSKIRLFGETTLEIDYRRYELKRRVDGNEALTANQAVH
jgi:hypothetical protein